MTWFVDLKMRVPGSGSNGCALGDVGKFLPPTSGMHWDRFTEFGMTKRKSLNTFHFLKSMMISSASSKYPNTSFWMLLSMSLRLNDAHHWGKTTLICLLMDFIMDYLFWHVQVF